jgi:hypothetical protein
MFWNYVLMYFFVYWFSITGTFYSTITGSGFVQINLRIQIRIQGARNIKYEALAKFQINTGTGNTAVSPATILFLFCNQKKDDII